MAVGFTRFGSFAGTKRYRSVAVFETPLEEQQTARRLSLDELELEPTTRIALRKLGVRTVGDLARLPAAGLRKRFGGQAHLLHKLATGEESLPLQPIPVLDPVQKLLVLDHPEVKSQPLLFLVKRHLPSMMATLQARGEVLASLTLRMVQEARGREPTRERQETVSPAVPTLDEMQILQLVRLRLESLTLNTGVTDLEITARGTAPSTHQARLFVGSSTRDFDAGNQALAKLRAELGDKAIVYARLQERHLPEAGFGWEPLEQLSQPRPARTSRRPMIRRLYARPRPVPPPGEPGTARAAPSSDSNETAGSLPLHARRRPRLPTRRGGRLPPLSNPRRILGPFDLSGAWWHREVVRRYHFLETGTGEVLWLFQDPERDEWFVQGRVE